MSVSQSTTSAPESKKEKVAQLAQTLAASGHKLSDADLEMMQSKVVALQAEGGHHEDHSHHDTLAE